MPAFPTSVSPIEVKVRPVYAAAQFDNPITLATEVQLLGGFRFEIDIIMQPMSPTEAADFGAFIQACAGGSVAFTFNLTPWAAGWSPAPGVKNFRLATPDTGWNAAVAREYGFSFTAIEDV
jgi:hypothetical protein